MITVVIPVYNRSEELRRALQSLAEQTVKDFEVIVCDDGSEENVELVVNFFISRLDIHYFRIEKSGSPARPRNVGIAHASREWISFLDSDDWWSPDRIQVISNELINEVDVLYHPLELAHSKRSRKWAKLGWVACKGRAIEGDPLTDMLSRGNPIPNSSAVVRKSLLVKIGGVCENKSLASFEDFDTWLTLASHGAHFLFIKRPLGFYWVASDNISVVSEKQIDRQRALFARHCNNLPDEVADWATSFNNYVIGTYALHLGRPQNALAALRAANHLRFRSQRLKRLLKIVIAAMKLTFTK